ncbi:co-chaperone GroES [Patescibacteria group bacterium]|nr:co-chaperone GroES [Patescibacteria group bacterium]
MIKLNLKPLGSRLIIKSVVENDVTKSGIILPETTDKEKPIRGEVLAVGPGKFLENGQREKIDLKVGDKILFEKYGSDEYKVDDQEFLVVDYDKVVAVVK